MNPREARSNSYLATSIDWGRTGETVAHSTPLFIQCVRNALLQVKIGKERTCTSNATQVQPVSNWSRLDLGSSPERGAGSIPVSRNLGGSPDLGLSCDQA